MATASSSAIQMLTYLTATITLEMGAVIPNLQMSKLRLEEVKKTLEKRARLGEMGQRDGFQFSFSFSFTLLLSSL